MIQFERLGIILEPEDKRIRSYAKFNPGMVLDGDVVHLVYRYSVWRNQYDERIQSNYAMDETRYARLTPEGKLVYEEKKPFLFPSLAWDISGCQDARITLFEGVYYLVYCAWDKDIAPEGKDKARVGIAKTSDFKICEKMGIINHYTWDKDAYLFPERINGKIAYVHRVAPNIQIDYFDSFEELLDLKNWEDYENKVESSTVLRAEYKWECGKVGGSVPPIKTEKGWLFIYHAVEFDERLKQPYVYRTGVALLDLENPSRVIARLPYPVLEPKEHYELFGDVDNVVFPVGGYIYKEDLYISYGGADRCVALAKVNLQQLLDELLKYPCK